MATSRSARSRSRSRSRAAAAASTDAAAAGSPKLAALALPPAPGSPLRMAAAAGARMTMSPHPSPTLSPLTPTRTSDSHAIRVDFLPRDPRFNGGSIGMTFAPGKQQRAWRDKVGWHRNVASDVRRLKSEYKIQVLEYKNLKIEELFDECAAHGIEVLRFSIPDGRVPRDTGAAVEFTRTVLERVRQSKNVCIHCMAGHGRTGTIAAAVLIALGDSSRTAIATVRNARRGTLQVAAQCKWLREAYHDELDRRYPPPYNSWHELTFFQPRLYRKLYPHHWLSMFVLWLVWWWALSAEMKAISTISASMFSCVEFLWHAISAERPETGDVYISWKNGRRPQTTFEQFWIGVLSAPIHYFLHYRLSWMYRIALFPFAIWGSELFFGYYLQWLFGYNVAWHYRGDDVYCNANIKLGHWRLWFGMGIVYDYVRQWMLPLFGLPPQ